MFGRGHKYEAAFPDAQWTERVVNPNVACLGLYSKGELIGLTGIFIDKEQPGLGHMVQSYIRKPHRRKGLSTMFYRARMECAKEHKLTRLEVGNRANNIAAIAANQHFGFIFSHSEDHTWPDGSPEDILYYYLAL